MVATIRIAGSCAEKAGATVLDDQHWPSALTAFVHAPIVEEKCVIVRWYCGHAPVVAVAAPHMLIIRFEHATPRNAIHGLEIISIVTHDNF